MTEDVGLHSQAYMNWFQSKADHPCLWTQLRGISHTGPLLNFLAVFCLILILIVSSEIWNLLFMWPLLELHLDIMKMYLKSSLLVLWSGNQITTHKNLVITNGLKSKEYRYIKT